jgi:hypothetical protein
VHNETKLSTEYLLPEVLMCWLEANMGEGQKDLRWEVDVVCSLVTINSSALPC